MFCFFCLDEEKSESEGEASDDEADPNDDDTASKNTDSKNKPTLEEYVKKHVFSRSN